MRLHPAGQTANVEPALPGRQMAGGCDQAANQNDTMLSLPKIQLVLLDGARDPLGPKVLDYVCSRIEFGDVLHLDQRMTYEEAMRYQARYMGEWLPDGFTHQLSIETDGFPVHTENWTDEFLEWDVIGAPWPAAWVRIEGGNRVGNGGCMLRSRRFIEAIRDVQHPPGMPGDVFLCQHPPVVQAAEAAGCRYAPLDVAMRWGREEVIAEFPGWRHDQSFSFHKTMPRWKSLLE
jgi:hypothetical protein